MKGLGLSLLGLLFGCAAAWLLYAGVTMNTAVPSADAPAGFQGVANLQLMHIQMLETVLGAASAIVSAIFFVGGSVVRSLAESSSECRGAE